MNVNQLSYGVNGGFSRRYATVAIGAVLISFSGLSFAGEKGRDDNGHRDGHHKKHHGEQRVRQEQQRHNVVRSGDSNREGRNNHERRANDYHESNNRNERRANDYHESSNRNERRHDSHISHVEQTNRANHHQRHDHYWHGDRYSNKRHAYQHLVNPNYRFPASYRYPVRYYGHHHEAGYFFGGIILGAMLSDAHRSQSYYFDGYETRTYRNLRSHACYESIYEYGRRVLLEVPLEYCQAY